MDNTVQSDLLNAGLIRQAMAADKLAGLGHLTLLQETGSTNTALLNLPADSQHAHAVLAEHQTDGRGRRQKFWHSPAGGNVYLSLGWRFRNSEQPLSTLPLAIVFGGDLASSTYTATCLPTAIERSRYRSSSSPERPSNSNW